MPLPLIIGIGAAIAGVTGVANGIRGGKKMKEANDTAKEAEDRHKRNVKVFEDENKKTTEQMDKLGETELRILDSFKEFSDIIEMIQNRPDFKNITSQNASIPEYNPEELKTASTGAAVLLGGLSGAAAGTAGATTAAVMALGTASTGTAIASLSGVAATNATLAAIGGGSLAAGGGGMALSSAVLGGATLGVGLLVGGIIFNFTGENLKKKADESWDKMIEAEIKIDRIVDYLRNLRNVSEKYCSSLNSVKYIYDYLMWQLRTTVYTDKKTDWNEFTQKEKLNTENLVMAVGLLYSMCKVKLVEQTKKQDELNRINYKDADTQIFAARDFVSKHKEAA